MAYQHFGKVQLQVRFLLGAPLNMYMLKLWYNFKSQVNITNSECDFIKNVDKINFEKNNYQLFPIYKNEILTNEFIELIDNCNLQLENDVAIFACNLRTIGFLHKDITPYSETGKYCNGSINCLLMPSRGHLEWFNQEHGETKLTEISSSYEGFNDTADTPIDKWFGHEGPALVNTSVAHRANNLLGIFPRVAVTVRFKNNPNWGTLVDKLSEHLDLTRK